MSKEEKGVVEIFTDVDELKKEQKRTKEKKAAMIEALKSTLGVVTPACELVGISRYCHYIWMNSDNKYKEAVNSMEDLALDFVESQLFRSIREGSDIPTIFYLKTKGKKRGYVERIENEYSGSIGVSKEDEKIEFKNKLSRMSEKDFEAFKKSSIEAQAILNKYEVKRVN